MKAYESEMLRSDSDRHLPGLPWLQKLSYGVGHVLNDLCASMWFSYLLLYFESINLFSKPMAGYVLLLGQVADAIATPLIGYESDRLNGCFGYGKRKSWHALGSVCVMVSFPFIFMQCIRCSDSSELARFFYYAPFIVIFQFGWASTQISHLALIPELTSSDNHRVELNAIRYAFTVISNLAVYSLTWLIISKADVLPDEKIVPADAPKFREIVFIVIGVGVLFTIIFHVGTKEESRNNKHVYIAHPASSSSQSYGSTEGTSDTYNIEYLQPASCQDYTWRDWLKNFQFYLVAVIYMCTRLIVNLSQIYLPMFVLYSLQLRKKYIAIMPLVVFITGFLASFFMKTINKEAGRTMTYILGLLLVCGGSSWMWFLPMKHPRQMFGAAAFLGVGTSTILVTSLAMTADLIGKNVNSGAFVYGAMSFTDKLSNGIAVVLIQYFHPCRSGTVDCCDALVLYYRQTIAFLPAGISGLAFFVILILAVLSIRGSSHNIGKRLNVSGTESGVNETKPLLRQSQVSAEES